MRLFQVVCVAFATFALSSSVSAQERIGIVLMHGKNGFPSRQAPLADALTAAGYAVERPEMCWSRHRIYDRSYVDCLHDADAAADKLKAAGATAIVVAGVDLGGNAAVGYGARRDGLKGVVAIGPAPAIEFLSTRPEIAKSLTRAREMIAAGHGDRKALFADVNFNVGFDVETTANIYVTFFAPDSPAVLPDNAAKLKAPLLAVSGMFDPRQRSVSYAFARAPNDPHNWHVTVQADLRGTVVQAREIVPVWLKLIAKP
jgi:pimeloyl-ACP methyl ester carboxylesterase